MIYHLFQALGEYDIPGQGLMNYLSFRAMMATVTAMLVALLAGKQIIRWLQRQQIGETVRELGLADQVQKKGTPTMGGIIIIISLLCGVLLWCDLTNIYVQLLLLSTLWCGALGFTDDYIKVFKHNKNGLSEHAKLIGQVALGFIVGLTVWMSDDIVVREKVASEVTYETELSADSQPVITTGSFKEEDVVKSTKTTIPFVKRHEFDYKWLSPFKGAMGWYAKWPKDPSQIRWNVAPGMPLLISEFGGEALYGQHGDDTNPDSWSEDYQAKLYRDNLRMFENIPNLCGISPWVLFDFRSPTRLHSTNQEGWNRKGLISDQGQRKEAWYIMHDYYMKKKSYPH